MKIRNEKMVGRRTLVCLALLISSMFAASFAAVSPRQNALSGADSPVISGIWGQIGGGGTDWEIPEGD